MAGGAHSKTYGVVAPDLLRSMSGLEFLTGIAAGRLPSPPIAGLMGFDLAEVERGRAVFTCAPRREHYNPIGSVHGGLAGTLLDSCMSCAAHSLVEKGQGYTTLEYRIHLVRGISDGSGLLRAEGKVVHPGRRIVTSEGRLTGADGTLYAHGTATCLVIEL